MALSPGTRLGTYEILSPLGAGGMGEVYRARDTKLDREVAIKVLPPATADDAATLARFEREAKAVAALSHPNILAIHDFGVAGGITYAVTELLQGETLRQRVDRGALPQRRTIEIAREIAMGLAAAHERGIVHRDLKPENLFLTKDGLLKILDFGLARKVRSGEPPLGQTVTDRSEPGTVLGTAGYMSPEQVRGSTADHRSDIFSFGAVLYEMVSGKRAFKGDTSVETMNAILREEPPALSESGRPISSALERIVAHCLEKQPRDRFQSARDLAFDLGALSTVTSGVAAEAISSRRHWTRRAALAAGAIAIAALGVWVGNRYSPGQRTTMAPTFRRLTFRHGNILSARFAPDGKTVVYGAAWEGKPTELFSARTDSIESRPLGIERSDIESVSSKGDLAILLKTRALFIPNNTGTLARLPLGGGAPRELLEHVFAASWAPNGEDLAAVRELENGKHRLEYPIGHPLYESFFLRGKIAVSPKGDLVAVTELEEDRTKMKLLIINREGKKRALVQLQRRISGLAWSPDSKEVFFVGGKTSESLGLRAVDLSGRERVILPALGAGLRLHDGSSDGRFLIERWSRRECLACRPAGEAKERELAWLDGSDIRDLSDDGRTILFRETGDGGLGSGGGVYVRRCDGSPAVRLGDEIPLDLSPDGGWVLAMTGSPPEIVMLPTGPGSPRRVLANGIKPAWMSFTQDGKRIAIFHVGEKGELKLSLMGLGGGIPKDVPVPRMISNGAAFSPDGALVAYMTTEGKLMTVPLSGGPARELPGPPIPEDSNQGIAGWSADGRFLYIAWFTELGARIVRREIATGRTSSWLDVQPADASGVTGFQNISITPDGLSYAYSYFRVEASDLFVVDGLR